MSVTLPSTYWGQVDSEHFINSLLADVVQAFHIAVISIASGLALRGDRMTAAVYTNNIY
jgi:hypothetical protein